MWTVHWGHGRNWVAGTIRRAGLAGIAPSARLLSRTSAISSWPVSASPRSAITSIAEPSTRPATVDSRSFRVTASILPRTELSPGVWGDLRAFDLENASPGPPPWRRASVMVCRVHSSSACCVGGYSRRGLKMIVHLMPSRGARTVDTRLRGGRRPSSVVYLSSSPFRGGTLGCWVGAAPVSP
jgi:hypothetical protein